MTAHRYCRYCDQSLEAWRPGRPCPSCGVVPGSDVYLVRQSNAGLTVLMLTGLALLVFSATGQPLGRWQAYELLALALCILATWFVLRQRRRQAIVHEGGIALIGRRGVRGVVAWPDVARVKVGDDVVELLSTEGVTLAQVNAEFFGSRRKLAEFAGAIAAQERDDAPWLP